MKKRILIVTVLTGLIVTVLLSQVAFAGGKRLDFQIEPGCVVEIYPLWEPGERGDRVFNLGRASWAENPPFITLPSGVLYDIELWCPGIAPTYQGTVHVQGNASGQQDIWFPLHNAEPGVFDGFYVTGGVE